MTGSQCDIHLIRGSRLLPPKCPRLCERRLLEIILPSPLRPSARSNYNNYLSKLLSALPHPTLNPLKGIVSVGPSAPYCVTNSDRPNERTKQSKFLARGNKTNYIYTHCSRTRTGTYTTAIKCSGGGNKELSSKLGKGIYYYKLPFHLPASDMLSVKRFPPGEFARL